MVTPLATRERGHFLTFETPAAGDLYKRLAGQGIITDVRGDRIRFGFGCYHTGTGIDHAIEAVATALGE